MSHENNHLSSNLGKETKEHAPSMGLVYSSESSPETTSKIHHQPIHQYINYQTTYEVPRYEYPKFRYDYGWPEYKQTVYIDRSDLYHQNPYKLHDNDRISQFFIGSLTVVGLFIVFRILEKNK